MKNQNIEKSIVLKCYEKFRKYTREPNLPQYEFFYVPRLWCVVVNLKFKLVRWYSALALFLLFP
jgi:hypothetical protein